MNFTRVLQLTLIHNKQKLLRLRYDLGRELVVIMSSAVLLGLFAYIFHDFLNEKLLLISTEQRERISHGFAVTVLVLLGFWLSSPLAQLWRSDTSVKTMAKRLGEDPGTTFGFLTLQTLSTLVLLYGIYWLSIGQDWGHWTLKGALSMQALSLGCCIFRLAIVKQATPEVQLEPILSDRHQNKKQAMVAWRWHQILRRNRTASVCIILSSLIVILTSLLLYIGAPFFLAILLCMVSSLLCACAPAFQLEEDMRSLWFERQLGCSHQEYVAIYQRICLALGLGLGGLFILGLLASGRFTSVGWAEWSKLLPIAALFPMLLPAVMFQVAPERPALQIMIVSLCGLFLGTAIFAHWASIFLVPIALHYAGQYQQNNFYRS